jgi:hypothetical protein
VRSAVVEGALDYDLPCAASTVNESVLLDAVLFLYGLGKQTSICALRRVTTEGSVGRSIAIIGCDC